MQITKNFDLREFASRDGACFPLDVIENIKKLAKALQVIRDEIGWPLIINSGYRSPEHNKNVGGAVNSFHLTGMAADIRSPRIAPITLFATIERLISEGKIPAGGLKAYNSFVHYDIRGNNARW